MPRPSKNSTSGSGNWKRNNPNQQREAIPGSPSPRHETCSPVCAAIRRSVSRPSRRPGTGSSETERALHPGGRFRRTGSHLLRLGPLRNPAHGPPGRRRCPLHRGPQLLPALRAVALRDANRKIPRALSRRLGRPADPTRARPHLRPGVPGRGLPDVLLR